MQQETLTGSALVSVMHKDRYFALPESVSIWLNQFNLKASDRLIFERLVSLAIQSSNRGNGSLTKRASHSLLVEKTGIAQRTVMNSLNCLEKKGLISKGNTSQKGTLFTINLSSEILRFIKERFVLPTKSTAPSDDKGTQTQSQEEENGQFDHQISALESQLSSINNQLKALQKMIDQADSEATPKGFTPLDILKSKGRLSFKSNPQLDSLQHKQTQLEQQALAIKASINKLRRPTANLNPEPNKGQNKLKEPSKKARFIGKGQIKSILTRVKRLKISNPNEVLNEVVWAIRNGWYTAKTEWDNFRCINHAMKMISNNTWRTPAGFKASQVVGLVAYAIK